MSEDTAYLEWRATATVPNAPDGLRRAKHPESMAEMSAKVEEYLSHEDTPHQATALTTDSWDVVNLLKEDADWTSLGRMQLDKDAAHILDAEATLEAYLKNADDKGKVQCVNMAGEREARIFCLSMFSHRWERPSLEAGKAFPDSEDDKKAKALGYYGRKGICPEFAQHQWDYYFWIDHACINQDDYGEKVLGIAKLPAYISCCIELIYYDSSTTDYERRAWTRLERVLGYAYTWSPAFVYMDDEYPDTPLHGERMRALVASQPGLYHLAQPAGEGGEGGEAEGESDAHTISMTITDPLGEDAHITDPRDRPYIEKMCEIVRRTKTLNPAFKGGGELVLGVSTMPVDTLHSELDCENRLVAAHEDSVGRKGKHGERTLEAGVSGLAL